MTDIKLKDYNEEVSRELADEYTQKALIATTFKNFTPDLMRQAIVEGMIRWFEFKNFLQKDVYAIKYGSGYTLITSIDYSRKIGQKSGIVWKTEPVFEIWAENKIISCTVTVKKRFQDGYVGDFSAKVYFEEYNTGMQNWKTKPRTMIAKVAEMHALRMACPEEMRQQYVEEEFAKGSSDVVQHTAEEMLSSITPAIEEETTTPELSISPVTQ